MLSDTLTTDLPPKITELCSQLSSLATETDLSGTWPDRQLQMLADAGVYRWFIPEDFGGDDWTEKQILEGYLAISQSCLTTTFILTQWNAACKRILGSDNADLRAQLLPKMATGELFATVGISHLSTSRQHVKEPVLKAAEQSDGSFLLNGFSPWVTGASHADVIVMGATMADNRQIMAAVPTNRTGVDAKPGSQLMALTGSCTDQVLMNDVRVSPEEILAGPIEQVLKSNSGGGTGGLQTSTLAIGLALAASRFLNEQSTAREDLKPIADKIAQDTLAIRAALFELTAGNEVMTASDLRQQANSLVLRATQAALQAAKGAGFIATHPTGRWVREAMFFLVWSCPQSVAQANLCELAQIS